MCAMYYSRKRPEERLAKMLFEFVEEVGGGGVPVRDVPPRNDVRRIPAASVGDFVYDLRHGFFSRYASTKGELDCYVSYRYNQNKND